MQVRLFAALRDAAGASVVEVQAATVEELLDVLAKTHGEPMTSRLASATVWVDGEPVTDDLQLDVTDAREVVVVPPFAGGA